MHTRPIPSTKEALPVVGLGTYRGFDVRLQEESRARLSQVIDTLLAGGGTVVDSSPMYGQAEQVVGTLLAERRPRPPAFLATKVWTRGRQQGVRQIEHSFRVLQVPRIDLVQIHNLVDWRLHLQTLRALKEEGRVRYIGITHYDESAYGDIESILRTEQLDFLQLNYNLGDPSAARRVLPLAHDLGVAVLCNMPFGGGGLLRHLRSVPLPTWASDVGATSWAQLSLKFVLNHPAITCVIPGTGNPESMAENLLAASAMDLNRRQKTELSAAAS